MSEALLNMSEALLTPAKSKRLMPYKIIQAGNRSPDDYKLVMQVIDTCPVGTNDLHRSPGRTLWIPDPASHAQKLKVKGIGLVDQDHQFQSPSSNPYFRIHKHIGVGPEGSFYPAISDPAPEGGMISSRARREFETAAALFPHGLALRPELVLEDQSKSFTPADHSTNAHKTSPESLGAVVLCATTDLDFANHYEDYAEGNDGGEAFLRFALSCLGEALRKLHQEGFYRFSGYPRNFAVSNNRAVLIDLDSTKLFTSDCKSELQASMHRTRDIASAIYGTICTLTSPRHHKEFDKKSPLRRPDSFAGLLDAYYSQDSNASCHELANILASCRSHAACYYRSVDASAVSSVDPRNKTFAKWRRAKYQQKWIRRFDVYSRILTSLVPLAMCHEPSMAKMSEQKLRENVLAISCF